MYYLLIGHELEGGFGSNFDDVHSVPSPKRPHSTFFDHLGEPTHYAHVVTTATMDLANKEHACLEYRSHTMTSLIPNALIIHSAI